jgi:hypothetical protein
VGCSAICTCLPVCHCVYCEACCHLPELGPAPTAAPSLDPAAPGCLARGALAAAAVLHRCWLQGCPRQVAARELAPARRQYVHQLMAWASREGHLLDTLQCRYHQLAGAAPVAPGESEGRSSLAGWQSQAPRGWAGHLLQAAVAVPAAVLRCCCCCQGLDRVHAAG